MRNTTDPCLCGLLAASADGSARVWDMEIGDCVLLMEGHTAAVTDLAVAEGGSLLVTCSADHTARVWGLDKGQCKAVLQGHTAAVNAVVVDTRGRFAVTASADATGRVWDLHSGQCVHVLRGHGAGAAGAGLRQACLLHYCSRNFKHIGRDHLLACMYVADSMYSLSVDQLLHSFAQIAVLVPRARARCAIRCA